MSAGVPTPVAAATAAAIACGLCMVVQVLRRRRARHFVELRRVVRLRSDRALLQQGLGRVPGDAPPNAFGPSPAGLAPAPGAGMADGSQFSDGRAGPVQPGR